MKAFLMYKDRDFDLQQKLPWNEQALTQDLELTTLLDAMALGDKFLLDVAKSAVLSATANELDTILYRQAILRDCLKNPAIVRNLYALAVETMEKEKKSYWSFLSKYPAAVLRSSIEKLQIFVTMLGKLKAAADQHAHKFESEGFTRMFAMLERELDDEYLAAIRNHLKELQFRGGVLMSAELGKGNKGANYVLRRSLEKPPNWFQRLFAQGPPAYSYRLHPRDESGARALSELNDRGINLVANALAQSTDHILSFFNMLRTELAFYVGCLNLHGRLAQKGEPVCFPLPAAGGERRHSFKGLYDVCLTLRLEQGVVGNDVNADDKNLVIITGANQGGKSTFLRSIGVSQLMMQCGMFVPAESFSANLCDRLFTHYKREEDVTMKSGKLDEELSRMSAIVDGITPSSMVLFNESLAATNEREGSQIARQIVRALSEQRIKMFFVTHLYQFAHGFVGERTGAVMFLRAERQPGGTRTFKLIEGEPLETSYGEDLYRAIFDGRGEGELETQEICKHA
jgi:DNA mismatch repair ATPase MutS